MSDIPPTLVFSRETDRRDQLGRAVARRELTRLARGSITTDTVTPPATVAHQQIWPILTHAEPGAVISDASVEDGGTGSQGVVYLVSGRKRPLELPGIVVVPRAGAGPVADDTPLPGGLWLAGEARALLDNLVPARKNRYGQRRTAGPSWVERRLDRLCGERGEDGLNQLRDQARAVAVELEREPQMHMLDALIGAALNTRPSTFLVTSELRARASGFP